MALGKATAQSSTFNSSTATGVSGNAVDGNLDADFQNGHCSSTNAADPSWWRVDLGANLVPVSEIFIVNRFTSSSSLQQRNKDYKITLGEPCTWLGVILSGSCTVCLHHCVNFANFFILNKNKRSQVLKATAQSSTFNHDSSTATGVSGNAVDGNPDADRLENACSLFTLYPSHQSIYHLFTFIISTR